MSCRCLGPFKGPAEKSGSLLPLPHLPRGMTMRLESSSCQASSSMLPLEALGIRSSWEGCRRTQRGPGQRTDPVSLPPGEGPAASQAQAGPLGRERYRILRLPCSCAPGSFSLRGAAPTASQHPPECRRGQDRGFSIENIITTGHPGKKAPGATGWV